MAESLISEAADKIRAADYLLVMTGAGFSADSGLPVYMDIANVEAYSKMGVEYHDLCDPYWIRNDLPVFYGFWGDCFNMYRDTTPHAGYEILQRWKARVVAKAANSDPPSPRDDTIDEDSPTTADPFFSFTSNVDAHFLQFFQPNEVYEIHGNTEALNNLQHWQCADESCSQHIWTLPSSFRFDIDKDTMRAADTDTAEGLTCSVCGGPARPNVLMFGDNDWIPNLQDGRRYNKWIARVQAALVKDKTKRLVILEIGCGTRVPSVRIQSEQILLKTMKKTIHTLPDTGEFQAHLIRVNPVMESDVFKWKGVDGHAAPMTKIEGFGLATLQAIDHELGRVDE